MNPSNSFPFPRNKRAFGKQLVGEKERGGGGKREEAKSEEKRSGKRARREDEASGKAAYRLV